MPVFEFWIRPSGIYKVKINGEWTNASWYDGDDVWFLDGFIVGLKDKDFQEIGNKISDLHGNTKNF